MKLTAFFGLFGMLSVATAVAIPNAVPVAADAGM